MTENIIVGLIVAAAAAFVIYKFLGKKNRGNCGCGCSGCGRSKPDPKENGSRPGPEARSSGCPACAARGKDSVNTDSSAK